MIYYATPDGLLTSAELENSGIAESVHALMREGDEAGSRRLGLIGGGTALKNLLLGEAVDLQGEPTDWKPIGVGKPLSITIRTVYTGHYPSHTKDMLVTSAVKSWTTNDAVARALNFMEADIKANSRRSNPSPTRKGTPVVYYTPALVDSSLTVGLELVFDKFNQQAFNQVGNAFTKSAAIPLFLPAAPFLIAAGLIAKLLGRLGEALIDRRPDIAAQDSLDFNLGGAIPPLPGFRLLAQADLDTVDPTFRDTWGLNEDGVLALKADHAKVYTGDIPYFVIGLDGREYSELKGFAPAAVAANVLGRFLHLEDGTSESLDVLVEGLQLLSDLRARRELDEIDRRLKSPTLSPEERQSLETRRDAFRKNIVEPLMRPPEAL